MSNEQQPQQRSASERLTDLENGLMGIYQTADNMAKDLIAVKNALKLLNNKVDSIVKASAGGEQINDDTISRLMIANNVADLKAKVEGMVAQGLLVSEQEVGNNSFLVGQEVEDDGKVINPRVQFALRALNEEFQAKIRGAKVGDLITLEEGKLKLEILESYSISSGTPAPVAAAAEAAPEAPVVEVAPEASSSEAAPASDSAPTIQ